MSKELIRLTDCTVEFDGEVVLDNLNIYFNDEEFLTLLGPSGCGKSMLLAQMAGLVSCAPGSVWVDGVLLTDATAAMLRQRMAWMGQQPHVFARSVARNVHLDRSDVPVDSIAPAMVAVGLGNVLQARPGNSLGEGAQGLSGGEAVRLALARLAVAAPHAEVLLVDEPTAHLDTATATEVADALVHMAQGRTLIVATHDPVLAARMDRVIALSVKEPA